MVLRVLLVLGQLSSAYYTGNLYPKGRTLNILFFLCSQIFCRTCSGYTAKIEHLGNQELRVCEVDYYRLNPNVKPKTAEAMERLAKFSESVSFFVG